MVSPFLLHRRAVRYLCTSLPRQYHSPSKP
jgi:hypothetical protein